MTRHEMFLFIRRYHDQPAPRRETDLDRQFHAMLKEDAVFSAFHAEYRRYYLSLEYWCKWTQNGFDEGPMPVRPDGISAEYEHDMLEFYHLA